MGARFVPVDDGQGEMPYLATAEVATAIGGVDIGILDYREDTTYLLVPGDDGERPAVTSLVLEALVDVGAIRPDDIVDAVPGSDETNEKFGSEHDIVAVLEAHPVARRTATAGLRDAELLRITTSSPASEADARQLTPREREVLTLVADGVSDREIATRLMISPHTVKTYLRRASQKLGVRTAITSGTGVMRER